MDSELPSVPVGQQHLSYPLFTNPTYHSQAFCWMMDAINVEGNWPYYKLIYCCLDFSETVDGIEFLLIKWVPTKDYQKG